MLIYSWSGVYQGEMAHCELERVSECFKKTKEVVSGLWRGERLREHSSLIGFQGYEGSSED